ncbi:MAG: Asp-tRNA(Asn)/Glu-tRNA(Gln) amidotransferase subunit GatA [Christensenellaceae bacterium]|jgi:aspartyl-tRNA(Asn)/glutamyl-tRNA(Gln) amidotransferase subunit A
MKLNELTVKQALLALDKKEISSEELTRACLDSVHKNEPHINALITVTEQQALAAAKKIDDKRAKGEKVGRLAGIPGILKDNISTRGVKTTAASKMLHNYEPVFNATVVDRLDNEDYVLVGKANMDEFAMGSSSETSYFGPVNNPWDTERVAGGSSGGSAAGLAAGEALFALGSDTGGSIRQPAAFCGVVGLKPTYGTVSRYGVLAYASSLDQVGTFTQNVEDAALVFDIISGHDPMDSTSATMDYPSYGAGMKEDIRGMKVGLPRQCMEKTMSTDVRESVMQAAKYFEEMGAQVVEVELPAFDYALSVYYVIGPAEAASNFSCYDGIRYGYRAEDYSDIKELYKKTRTEGFGDEVKRRIMLGNYVLSSGYYDAYYLKALKTRTLIKNDYDKAFEKCDVLISPMTDTTAFKKGSKTKPLDMYAMDLFTVSVNIAGHTAISVPAGLGADGMPMGLQIIAKAFDENTLFKAAYNFEQKAGFTAKPKL